MAAKAVHLEGMGVLGSFLAYELESRGLQWTWHDIETPVNAWMACTGAIFPSGEPVDQQCFATWMQWLQQRPELEGFVERAEWWYCTQAPPHGAKGRSTWTVGPLKRHPVGSLHLHAQRFVKQTRRRFNERRRPRVTPNAVRIVAHGFSERLDHYVWGWAKKVRLRVGGTEGILGPRQAFYLRRGRFVMAYAYPVPGEPWWYAGSSLIVQKAAKPLEVEPKFATWQRHVAELSGGLVEIVEVGPYMQGWRPVPAKDDEALARWIDGSLHVRPLWHNGVRIAPALVQAVMEQLNVYAWSTA